MDDERRTDVAPGSQVAAPQRAPEDPVRKPEVGLPLEDADDHAETAPHEAPVSAEAATATAGAATGGAVSGRSASLWGDAWRELRKNPLFIIATLCLIVFAVMAIWPRLFTDISPYDCDVLRGPRSPVDEFRGRPQPGHPFGFDTLGCDYFSRVIYGTRASFIVGFGFLIGASIIALVLGGLAGYYGGWWDTIIARIADIWFAIPLILGGIIVLRVAFEGETMSRLLAFDDTRVFRVTLVLVLFGWPTMMRLMRSSILSAKEEDYVDAARTLGANDWRIVTRHILPNSMAPVVVYATISVGIAIAAEATLSFLGVGLLAPQGISWGLMISVAQNQIRDVPHLLVFPAIFLSVMVFSFILLGDALRDALDPKLR